MNARRSLAAALSALILAGCSRAQAATCDDLAQTRLEHVTIVSAKVVSAGTFRLPGGRRAAPPEFFVAFDSLPAFCRVQAVSRPSRDSHIGIEVWLPLAGWNERYLGAGNGGYGGSFNYYRLGEGLNDGYVVSSTDTGHRGAASDRSWAEGNPEKQLDFDYRAVHETATTAKALIAAFYRRGPQRSYFSSCSNGGRQGVMEAERFPADYDGIFAGAPALHYGLTTEVTGKLDAFAQRGGKIIIYHGGSDGPEESVAFYNELSRRMGEERLRNFMQLYVVPKMGHCGSGPEPNDIGQWLRPGLDREHSLFEGLKLWVESGVAPTQVIATRFVRDGDARSGVAKTTVLYPYR
jgi:hypothetical protein